LSSDYIFEVMESHRAEYLSSPDRATVLEILRKCSVLVVINESRVDIPVGAGSRLGMPQGLDLEE